MADLMAISLFLGDSIKFCVSFSNLLTNSLLASSCTANFLLLFELGGVSRESIDSTLIAYNNYCTEMRSEARDNYISVLMSTNS